MPSDSFDQLLDRAASWFGIGDGFWDIFGHYHTTSAAAKQSILRALGVAADSSVELEQALAALARNQWERLLPPAGGAGGARTFRGAARERRKRRIRSQSVGTAAGGLGGNGRPHVGARAGRIAHATAAGLSRGDGQRGREPRDDTLHRDAGACVYGPAPGTRRARGGNRGQPVRRA